VIGIERLRQLSDHAFYRLVRLSLDRMLYGAHAGTDEIESSVGLTLSLLALPGAFLSLLLFNKYGSLLRLLRGQVHFDPYAASLPDEYFFIVLSMLVSAAVGLWKWDSIFLNRRDYLNLVPLPISTRTIFGANLLALLIFAGLFSLDVNAASAILFPVVVSSSQESFLFFGKIFVGHFAAIATASLFSFLFVFAAAGASMALLPARYFRTGTALLRSSIAVGFLALFSSSFTVSTLLQRGLHLHDSRLRFLPSLWFLGVCQWARGAVSPEVITLALFAAEALVCTLVISAVGYGLAYNRHFITTAERVEGSNAASSTAVLPIAGRLLDRMILTSPFQQAAFRFVVKTLARSDRHRTVLTAFLSAAAVIATQLLVTSGVQFSGPDHVPAASLLATPLMFIYCLVTGVRFSFDVPVELAGNWIFRFLLPPTLSECSVFAQKTLLILVMPVIFLFTPMFLYGWGWRIAIVETIFLISLSWIAAAALVANFQKLPFTCAPGGFRHGALVKVVLYVVGFVGFSFVIATIEHWALLHIARMLVFVPVLVIARWSIRVMQSNQMDMEKQITFEDTASYEIAVLKLTY
jgi:hypothetical protein